MLNSNSTAATLKEVYGDKNKTIHKTIDVFFDAISFEGIDEVLHVLLHDYIITDQETSINVANTVHNVRLLRNLVMELSMLHKQQHVLSKQA